MSHSTITFLVLAAVVVVFTLDRVPVAIVAIGTALALWATGVLDLNQALAGFGDPTVLFIGSLFVVSEALEASGVTAWAGQTLIEQVGESRTRLIVLMSLLVAGLTALINVNGAVAALVPVVVVMAVRLNRRPGAASDAARLRRACRLAARADRHSRQRDHLRVGEGCRRRRVRLLLFALVGVPLLVGTIAIILLFGERLLPDRRPRVSSRNFSEHARTLVDTYSLDGDPDMLLSKRSGVAEIVIPPRSELIGELAYPGMVTDSGDLIVLAVQRLGEDIEPGETMLAAGDSLLLQGSWGALEHHLDDPSVVVVDSPEAVRRQTVPLGLGAWESIGVLVTMVVLLATGAVPPAVAGLLAAGALVLLRVLTIDQAYRGISWTTVILVGGMISLSTAMTESGAAEKLANELVRIVGGHGGYALLAGLFLLTALLGQLISNMATALIVLPIGVTAAQALGISTLPVLMCINIAAAASFLTPVATPVNLIVMGPGGYRFGDYWKTRSAAARVVLRRCGLSGSAHLVFLARGRFR